MRERRVTTFFPCFFKTALFAASQLCIQDDRREVPSKAIVASTLVSPLSSLGLSLCTFVY